LHADGEPGACGRPYPRRARRFQVQPVPSDKEFVCTNADNGIYGDPDPCGFTVTISRNNPIVLNFLGRKRVGWLMYFPTFSR